MKGLRGDQGGCTCSLPLPEPGKGAAPNSLAVIGVVGHGVRQPPRLVVQAVILWHEAHSNGAPHTAVHN